MPEKLSAAVEMRQIVFPNETQYRFELVSIAAHDHKKQTTSNRYQIMISYYVWNLIFGERFVHSFNVMFYLIHSILSCFNLLIFYTARGIRPFITARAIKGTLDASK